MFVVLGIVFADQRPAGAFLGHTISVDGATADWVGETPEEPNTWTISNGEYIWKDATGDDTGNGHYQYPLNRDLSKGCDLREFRVTYDEKNLYLLIRCNHPRDYWTPLRIIGIHKGAVFEGMTLLAQGNRNEPNFDTGVCANLKVSPALACQYVIAISSSAYKGRIWEAAEGGTAKLIARRDGGEEDTPDFKVESSNWNLVEVGIPLKLLGSASGGLQKEVWKFLVAIGQQDFDVARKIGVEPSEWNGGGGAPNNSNPYVYDLAGADKETQEKELGSYDASAAVDDPAGFATIEQSFVKVDFSSEGPGKLTRRGKDETGAGFLSGINVSFPALLSR